MNDQEVKTDVLNKVNREGKEAYAYLSALIASCGEITITNRALGLELITVNGSLPYDFSSLIKNLYGYGAEIAIIQPEDKRHNRRFSVYIPEKIARTALNDTKILVSAKDKSIVKTDFGASMISKENERYISNYIKGLFLSSGKVFIYEGNYLAELILPNSDYADEIASILKRYNIITGQAVKGDKVLLTIKSGECVSDFLALIGASDSALELKDILIKREMRNRINREANCEAANSDRNAQASVKQIKAILYIQEKGRTDKLTDELKEVAEKRLKNPDISMSKLADMLKITKSGLSHRFKKLIALAEELKKEERK